jgi:hypothetical protein
MIDLFFSRSGHCPLHIYLPTRMAHPARILLSVEKRLKCFSTDHLNNYVKGRIFPALDRLYLYPAYERLIEISHFNDIQFPSLRHLICKICLTNSISGSSGVTEWRFPPLQTLSVQITSDLAWLSLLTAVKDTLISLSLYIFYPCPVQSHQIALPALKCLDIRFWPKRLLFWPLHLKTPVLETYLEFTRQLLNQPGCHRDIQNVRAMRSDYPLTLSSFPLLEILQLEDESHISAVFAKLASNESICPNLQEVELVTCSYEFPWSLEEKLPDVNRCRRIPVKLVVHPLGRELPYAIKPHPVRLILALISCSYKNPSAETECLATSIEHY